MNMSFSLCLLILLQARLGLQSFDSTRVFASVGGSVCLPCGIPNIRYCSSINWSRKEQFGIPNPVVKSGVVVIVDNTEKASRLSLGRDCTLQIDHLKMDDGRVYTCEDGATSSTVSLQLLTINQTPREMDKSEGMDMELQCHIDNFNGGVPCHNHSGIHLKWLSEANTVIKGDRFQTKSSSPCIFSLHIKRLKKTDHHRKWRCQLTEGHIVKTTLNYTITLADGVEEVFATMGESVSFSCDNTFPLGIGGRLQWTMGDRSLFSLSQLGDITAGLQDELPASYMNQDGSLVISDVSALHSGQYNCAKHNKTAVLPLNTILLHTLGVTAKYASPGNKNLTLTCLLTCALGCEDDFNLTWTHSAQDGWQSDTRKHNNNLTSKLFLPDPQTQSTKKIACSVFREGVQMAVREWAIQDGQAVPVVAWLSPLVVIMLCAVGGGVYLKRKYKRDEGNEQSNVGMTHIYEDIQEPSHAEVSPQTGLPGGVASRTNDSFYDLLQAVN